MINEDLRIYESNLSYYLVRNRYNQLDENILNNDFEYKIYIKRFDIILYSLITLISFIKNFVIIDDYNKLEKNINCYGDNNYLLISLIIIYSIHSLLIFYMTIINIKFYKTYYLKNKFLNKIESIITKMMILNIIIFINIAFILIGYILKCLESVNKIEFILSLHILEFIFLYKYYGHLDNILRDID